MFNGAAASWAALSASWAAFFVASSASGAKLFTAFCAFAKSSASFFASSAVTGPFTAPGLVVSAVISPASTSNFTVLVKLSAVSTTAFVPLPFTKFTVSNGFTKSTALPLPCRFQPAFNTSDTVAALLPTKLGLGFPSFVGFNKSAASFAVNGALLILFTSPVVPFSVPSGFVTFLSASFTAGMLFFTFFNVVGAVVPSGPLIDVITSPFGISLSP